MKCKHRVYREGRGSEAKCLTHSVPPSPPEFASTLSFDTDYGLSGGKMPVVPQSDTHLSNGEHFNGRSNAFLIAVQR